MVAAVLVVAFMLLSGGSSYTVNARFLNSSQLVNGNQVLLSGRSVGSVEKISVTDDNRAEVKLKLLESVAPLPQGTKMQIRSTSLSGVANRYIELKMPEDRKGAKNIKDGGTVPTDETTSEVDLDQIFNTLDRPTRQALQQTIKGLKSLYQDAGKDGNKAIELSNPLISTSRRFIGELNRDEAALEGLIVDGAKVTGALKERRPDVAGLITNLNDTTAALSSRRSELARSINQLPPFMRQANTTFANLRGALTDVDPLVEASKPVARRLRPFLPALRRFATGAVPTIRDLSAALRRPGADNDLVELTRAQPALARIGVGPVQRNGATRQGTLPESVTALRDSIPNLSFFRPYTPELVGWFDDFGHSGQYDANGGFGRIFVNLNAFAASVDNATNVPVVGPLLTQADRITALKSGGGVTGYRERCPGSGERDPGDGSTPFTDGGKLDCDVSQVPVGP